MFNLPFCVAIYLSNGLKARAKMKFYFSVFSLCVACTREPSGCLSNQKIFKIKKRNSKLKFFYLSEYGSGHSSRARKAGRYTSPPRCSSIHSPRHRYSGTNTIFFLLFAFPYIYSSINQSINQCGRCFLLVLLLRASR